MFVVVPIRGGRLPAGGAEVVSEFGKDGVLLIGEGTRDAAEQLRGIAKTVACAEVGSFRADAWSTAIAETIVDPVIVVPGSPDGRDLAPRIAAATKRGYFGSCADIRPEAESITIQMSRWGGLAMESVVAAGACVVTVMPGLHSVTSSNVETNITDINLELRVSNDAEFIEERQPDAATIDLAEASQIFGGGAGLKDEETFTRFGNVAANLGASLGATRVVTDRGWVGHSRQIGTTGVVVDPDLYVAFGVSGAVQHTSGLGQPSHIISVNMDPHCPMMQMADLAIVCDANEVVAELERRTDQSEGAA